MKTNLLQALTDPQSRNTTSSLNSQGGDLSRMEDGGESVSLLLEDTGDPAKLRLLDNTERTTSRMKNLLVGISVAIPCYDGEDDTRELVENFEAYLEILREWDRRDKLQELSG